MLEVLRVAQCPRESKIASDTFILLPPSSRDFRYGVAFEQTLLTQLEDNWPVLPWDSHAYVSFPHQGECIKTNWHAGGSRGLNLTEWKKNSEFCSPWRGWPGGKADSREIGPR